MKRMLQIIDTSTCGGAEKHTLLIVKEFARRGYPIVFVFPDGPFAQEFKNLNSFGVKCVQINFRKKPLWGAIQVRRLLKENQIQIIHSHHHIADFTAGLASLGLPGLRHVTTIHFLLENMFTSGIRKLVLHLMSSFGCHRAHRIFALSEAAGDSTCRTLHLPASKITIIRNAIDTSELNDNLLGAEAIRREFKLSGSDYVIINMGSLFRNKGQATLINAMARRITDPSIKLFLLGEDGGDREQYEKLVRAHHLESQVFFPGHRKDITAWLTLANLYVQSSHKDNLPRSILEAMYYSKPVIVTNLPTLSGTVIDGVSGLIVDRYSEDAMADAILRLKHDPTLAESIGKAGHDFVKQHCTIEQMADAISLSF